MLKPYELYELICDSEYETSGNDVDWTTKVIDNTVYLLFQETTSKIDWKVNFDFWIKPYKNQENKMWVHRGFCNSYKSCNDEIMKKFIQVVNENPDKEIVISGWSYGGAMTYLAAEDFNFRTGKKAKVVNFGAPSIIAPFGFKTRKHFDESMESYEFYSDKNDIVTYVPPFYIAMKRIRIDKFKFGGIFNPNVYHCIYGNKDLYKE